MTGVCSVLCVQGDCEDISFFPLSRTSLEYSKKWGTLALVNQLMKIYFKVTLPPSCHIYNRVLSTQINKLHLCKPLVRAIDSSDIKDQFSMADLVTYK